MRSPIGWCILLGVTGAAAGTVGLAHWKTEELRARLDGRRYELGSIDELRGENERRRAKSTATQGETDPGAIERARAELSLLEHQLWKASAASEPGRSEQAARFAAGTRIPASEWKNLGRATPQAAVETALWAAAGGDVDAFERCLVFVDETARREAESLLQSLTPEQRSRYQSPERLIAELTIPNIPIVPIEIREWGSSSNNSITFVSGIFDGSERQITIPLRYQADGWKLMVIRPVIAKFASQVKGE